MCSQSCTNDRCARHFKRSGHSVQARQSLRYLLYRVLCGQHRQSKSMHDFDRAHGHTPPSLHKRALRQQEVEEAVDIAEQHSTMRQKL